MITDEHVRIERDGHVVTVTLDRPGTRNACSMNMWLAIRDAFATWRRPAPGAWSSSGPTATSARAPTS